MRTALQCTAAAVVVGLIALAAACAGTADRPGSPSPAAAQAAEAAAEVRPPLAGAVPALDPFADPAPPPPSVYTGPLFELSHDYPAQPVAPPEPAPWRVAIGNGTIDTGNAAAYVQALKDSIAEDMQVLLFDYPSWDAGAAGWYNQPWLAPIRDPIHGTYVGSSFTPQMFPKSGLTTDMTTHVLVYYDDVAASSLQKVWGTSGLNPVPGIDAGGAQFPEGSIIVKPAFTTTSGEQWPPIAGAFPWQIYAAPGDGTTGSQELQTVYLFQFDIIVKDSASAPKTGWVFSTLVYDRRVPVPSGGSPWDQMVALGAMWGNDPAVDSPQGCDPSTPGSCPPLAETWIDAAAPAYSKETLGWGGRLSGPNDGAVDIAAAVVDDGGSITAYPGRYAMSSCMGCHGSAEYVQGSFLLPSPAACEGESCTPTFADCDAAGHCTKVAQPGADSRLVYFAAGSADFGRWFQDRPGDVPMNSTSIALDYGMNVSFKALPAWYDATQGPKEKLPFVEAFNNYRGLPREAHQRPRD